MAEEQAEGVSGKTENDVAEMPEKESVSESYADSSELRSDDMPSDAKGPPKDTTRTLKTMDAATTQDSPLNEPYGKSVSDCKGEQGEKKLSSSEKS